MKKIEKQKPLEKLWFIDTHSMARDLFKIINEMIDKMNEVIEVINKNNEDRNRHTDI